MIADDRTAYVACRKDGKLLNTYDFLCPASAEGWMPPRREELITNAQHNLMLEGLAKPPFDGVEYEITFRP